MGTIKYTTDHEWIRVEEEGIATVGITHYAQDTLGDIVYVELPQVGLHFQQGSAVCVVESVKAAADVNMPVAGKIVAVNARLSEQPQWVNTSPDENGWFVRIAVDNIADLDGLMEETQYQAYLK